MSARRYEGKEKAALLSAAESWEKQASGRTDYLVAIHTHQAWGEWWASILESVSHVFRLPNMLARLAQGRARVRTIASPKPLVFAFVVLAAGIFTTQSALDGDSAAVKASEADLLALTAATNSIGTRVAGYQSAGIAPPKVAAVAIAEVRPVTFTSLMPVLSQDVKIADSNRDEQEPRNRFWEGVHVQRDGDKFNVDILGDVLFPRNSATLRPRARALISSIAADLKQYSFSGVDVNSFTDTSGTFEHNQLLSGDRANAVADELARNGVDQGRIRAQGFGETHLVVPTPDGVRERRNRRIAIVLAR